MASPDVPTINFSLAATMAGMSSANRLRVMADCSGDPVWSDEGGEDLDDLPISWKLRRGLHAWAALYDTLPSTRFRFQTPGGRRGFNDTGKRLAKQLASELGPDWVITYVPE